MIMSKRGYALGLVIIPSGKIHTRIMYQAVCDKDGDWFSVYAQEQNSIIIKKENIHICFLFQEFDGQIDITLMSVREVQSWGQEAISLALVSLMSYRSNHN